MILLINLCNEKLHYFEFVKPIEIILKENNFDYDVKAYDLLKNEDLKSADKVIICGTSLADNHYLKNYKKFSWIKDYEKPIFGICGGMQIIGLIFKGKLMKKTEIGYYKERFNRNFLGFIGEQEVYHLHNYYIRFSKDFEIFVKGICSQAVKHRNKFIYGVLFHPEVRQKELIINFCEIKS